MPTVTVGISFYRNRETLLEAVRSVFAQTLPDWELLLIDDGSDDGSDSLVASIRDSRVRLVSDGVNRGYPARLNQISRLAAGDYIARMDADDLMHPERLALQVALLRARPEIDLVCSEAFIVDAAAQPRGIRGGMPSGMTPSGVVRGVCPMQPTIMGRREWFASNPYSEEHRRVEDWELWLRSCQSMRLSVMAERLLYYREVTDFDLGRYRLDTALGRRHLRTHAAGLVGSWAAALALAASYAKESAYIAASSAGIADYLIRRRSRPLDEGELDEARLGLARIRATAVPGVDQ